MMLTRAATTLLVLALCCASPASGQTAASRTQVATPAAPAEPENPENGAARQWTFSAMLSGYNVPGDRLYPQPTVTADRRRLHLEARYNYEDLDTGSAWVGYNLGGGEKVAWELTPMVGGVFGNVVAVAPGYRGSVGWRKLEFASEGEYVFGSKDDDEWFFYNWSELTVAPADWWRVGLATQRTRAYAADRDTQRGIVAGFSYRSLDAAFYLFNPDDDVSIVVATVSFGF